MSGYTPIALSLGPFKQGIEIVGPHVLNRLKSDNVLRYVDELPLSRLVFSAENGEWVDTEKLPKGIFLEHDFSEYSWLRASGLMRLGESSYPGEIYFFPLSTDDSRTCCEVKFHSQTYEAIYQFSDRSEGKFNEQAKKALLKVCLGLVSATEADAFIVRFDDGELSPLHLEDILSKLRSPELTLHGKRPDLITGIRDNFLSLDELTAIWGTGEEVYESVSGYVILDLLQRSKSIEQ
jgi:hypothetical protein